MADRKVPTAEYVRSILDYDPDTGILRWRTRTPDVFAGNVRIATHICAVWNSRHAGHAVSCIDRKGYLKAKISGHFYRAHRIAWLIMTGAWPADEIDHCDLDKANNRWTNLREASRSQNQANKRISSNNTSGYKGVRFSRKKWVAEIKVNRRRHYLGSYERPEDAHAAYCSAAYMMRGEFARGG